MATVIDQEVKRIIDECYDRARHIIRKYDDVLHACADLLLKKKKISRKNLKRCSRKMYQKTRRKRSFPKAKMREVLVI